jgi:hypothetical protein
MMLSELRSENVNERSNVKAALMIGGTVSRLDNRCLEQISVTTWTSLTNAPLNASA